MSIKAPENETDQPVVETIEKKPSGFKIIVSTAGVLFAISHLGLLGYLIDRKAEPEVPQVPTINIPRGDYSSYTIEAGPQGYKIQYKANDPAILESERSLDLDKNKKGFFEVVLSCVVSIVVINTRWTVLAISEVASQTLRESRMP